MIGIYRILRRGLRITIIPTYACNLDCEYCSRKINGETPTSKVKNLDEWKGFLTDLDNTLRLDGSKIKEIILNGGEPTLLDYFESLCNWILKKGWLLTVYTNLTNQYILAGIKRSPRLIIHATYHPDMEQARFYDNWFYLRQIHRIRVDEVGERRLNFDIKTHLKPYSTDDELKNKLATIRVDPNLRMYLTCYADAKDNIRKD